MKRSKTPSFCLTVKLNTSERDNRILDYRFLCGQRIYNVLVRHCRKQFSKLAQDPTYRELLVRRASESMTKQEHNRINDQLARIRMEYGLSRYQLYNYVAAQQHRYKNHMDSRTALL